MDVEVNFGIHRLFIKGMETKQKKPEKDVLMEELGESLGYIQAFVQQEIESVKLEVAEKISLASSFVITGMVLLVFGSLVAIFASIALGFFLADVFSSKVLGFLAVAGLFLVLLILVFLFRKPLVTDHVVSGVIHLLFDQEEDESD